MKAVGFQENLPIENTDSLQDIEMEIPVAQGRDILVEVKAISVNPVDYKIRHRRSPAEGEWSVIGWDAAGIVKEVGPDVTLFQVGDEVWYAGDLTRPGSNAEFQLVDERIVGRKPIALSFSEAAALPLTSLTAWELLFDRMQVDKNAEDKVILVIGAAGGVGSILVQLVKKLTKLKLVATASREETTQWLQALGADHIINHHLPLSDELTKTGLKGADYVISLNATDQHFDEIVKLINPQGKFGLIDDPKHMNIMSLKTKSVSTHIELMFTRSMFETSDMIEQHHILNHVTDLIDNGTLTTTVGDHFGIINAENLRKAHALLESGKARGKIVLEGF